MIEQRVASILMRNPNVVKWSRLMSSSHSSSTKSSSTVNANVPGLSDKCLKVPNTDVGPGASANGQYKVPEYFCFDKTSYFEAEIEILKYRLPQPSSVS